MPDVPAAAPSATDDPATDAKTAKAIRRWKRWRRIRRTIGVFVVLLMVGVVIGRIYLGVWVKWYVNRTIDQNPTYRGKVGDIKINLYRGQYSISDIKLQKRVGEASAPLFQCERLDLAVDWQTLLHGKVKASAYIVRPQINFVRHENPSDDQTAAGAAGPWLGILQQLSPFDINSAVIHDGSMHFKAPDRTPIVDVFLDQLDVSVTNLSNVVDRLKPLNAQVDITGRAMKSGKLECHVKFDPTSYKPTFQLALRLLRLDVTETNAFTRAYGKFDFESGLFYLVVELNAREGALDGYIKPLFRHLQIVGARDFRGGNLLNGFYQALLGLGEVILQNQPRDQFGTQIPVSGILDAPKPDILTTIGNVLRNAFIRAYLPRLEGTVPDVDGLEFRPGTELDVDADSDLKEMH